MVTYRIYKNGTLYKEHKDQFGDICVYMTLHKAQSQSLDWALKNGWKVVEQDQETGIETEW